MKRERNALEKCSKGPNFFFFWQSGSKVFIFLFVTIRLLACTKCVPLNSERTQSVCRFLDSHATSISDFECSFECLQKL